MSAVALHAAHRPGFEARLAQSIDTLGTAAREHAGRIVQATSLGVEDMVVTDIAARHGLAIPVATLDTGLLHAETSALLARLQARYDVSVEVYRPHAEAAVAFVARHGERAMYASQALRKACCEIRKREPLARMLAGRRAWITGLRRDQSEHRATVPLAETDTDGLTKFNPLAHWSLSDVWHYVERFDVPYNPLHDQHYPSIGCAPCTRAVAAGEDVRAGRWWWEEAGAKECGLHVAGSVPVTRIDQLTTGGLSA